MISPSTSPLTTTVFERIVAWISPLSPTIRVFSLAISPRKRPSMRTVSRNESLPSNSEPWSMKALSPPALLPLELLDPDPPPGTSNSEVPRPNDLSAMRSSLDPGYRPRFGELEQRLEMTGITQGATKNADSGARRGCSQRAQLLWSSAELLRCSAQASEVH